MPDETVSDPADTCKHTWRFRIDDDYIQCGYCGEVRDSVSDRIVKAASPDPAAGEA